MRVDPQARTLHRQMMVAIAAGNRDASASAAASLAAVVLRHGTPQQQLTAENPNSANSTPRTDAFPPVDVVEATNKLVREAFKAHEEANVNPAARKVLLDPLEVIIVDTAFETPEDALLPGELLTDAELRQINEDGKGDEILSAIVSAYVKADEKRFRLQKKALAFGFLSAAKDLHMAIDVTQEGGYVHAEEEAQLAELQAHQESGGPLASKPARSLAEYANVVIRYVPPPFPKQGPVFEQIKAAVDAVCAAKGNEISIQDKCFAAYEVLFKEASQEGATIGATYTVGLKDTLINALKANPVKKAEDGKPHPDGEREELVQHSAASLLSNEAVRHINCFVPSADPVPMAADKTYIAALRDPLIPFPYMLRMRLKRIKKGPKKTNE